MATLYEKLKAAATTVGVVWNVASANDSEAINYVKSVLQYQDRKRIEEQLRRQGDSDAANKIS